MPVIWTVLIVLALANIGFFLGRSRALTDAGGDVRELRSLPAYYGDNAAIFTSVPALSLMILWMLAQHHRLRPVRPDHRWSDVARRLCRALGPWP